MVIAGLRHLDRVRGSGWLDCPHCGEHAAQDVIDDMTFLTALYYRFTPVARSRVLMCRRCGYRRVATAEEMAHLETAGTRIRRAVMFPLGLLGLGLLGGLIALIWIIGNSSGNALAEKIQFTPQTGQGIMPVKFDGPSSWNIDPEGDADPPSLKYSDAAGRMYFTIRRVTDAFTLEAILAAHFDDEVGIRTQGFPETPPKGKTASIADQHALYVTIDYTEGAEKDQQNIYAFAHNGVGYVITYVALGDDAISTMKAVADKVNGSFKFTATETPPPQPSETASPSSSASATP